MLKYIFTLLALFFFEVGVSCTLENFHVCTVANTLEKEEFFYLKDSCKKNKIDLTIIGIGLPYYQNGTKLVRMREHLATLPDEAVVLFVDAFDVMILKSKEEILTEFLSMNIPFLIAAERGCFPYPQLKTQFPQEVSFPYLNAGGYIGYVSVLKKWIDSIFPNIPKRDQGQITKHYLRNKNFYTIDHDCRLFLCLLDVIDEEVSVSEDGQVFCNPTGTTPAVLHANGATYRILSHVYQKIMK